MAKTDEIKQLIDSDGKYLIGDEFLEGANGYSFRATHRHLGHDVFLKVIDADPEVENTFAEPRALIDAGSGSGCENLVRLYDAEHLTKDYVLMAMEFIEGGSLNSHIGARTIGQSDAVQLAMGVLVGVGRLHSAGFVHRDIKPGNLLLADGQTGPTVKLGDFGSVRRVNDDTGRVSASRHSALYRPKEAWGDHGWFSYTSDLYQLGVCLYELTNGPLPYELKDYLDPQAIRALKKQGLTYADLDDCDKSLAIDGCLERRVNTGKVLEMRPPAPYYSRRLATVIRKATAIEPDDRYRTAFEFRNALQALSIPNWREVQQRYDARSWKDWDWMVEPGSGRDSWTILRSRPGAQNYRTFRKNVSTANEACRVVEDFG